MYFLKESTKDVGHFDSTHPLTTFVPDSYLFYLIIWHKGVPAFATPRMQLQRFVYKLL